MKNKNKIRTVATCTTFVTAGYNISQEYKDNKWVLKWLPGISLLRLLGAGYERFVYGHISIHQATMVDSKWLLKRL